MSMEPSSEPLTPERRRAMTINALLDAAAAVFARKGYEAGTLEEIAAAAGFTTGAIYSNFGSKQELFVQVIERRNSRLLDAYKTILDAGQAGEAGLHAVAQVWAEHELADRDALLLTLEIRVAALRDNAIAVRVREFERATEAAIARFIDAQLDAADPRPQLALPTNQLAALLYAANQGIWQHAATCGSEHSDLFLALLRLLVPQGKEQTSAISPHVS